MCQEEFGYERMVHYNLHLSDNLTIPEGTARANWYGVSGIPHVRIDGKYSVIGAANCETAAANYRNRINQRLNETGGLSPVEIKGNYLPIGTTIPVEATFRLVDPATLTSLRATLVLYEDNVYLQGSYWQHVTRVIYDQYVTLANVGDEVTVSTIINPAAEGIQNIDQVHAVAYLQQTSGDKQMIQGAKLPIGDFSFEIASRIGKIPAGNGQATFDAVLTNISDDTDTYTLEIANPFGDWLTEYQVCGDPTWRTDPVDVDLSPDQSCDVLIRVTTDDVIEKRLGSFRVTSHWSTRSIAEELRIFNGSYAVLFVDDDRNHDDEIPLLAALDANQYLYDHWDVYYDHGGNGPTAGFIADYDYVIWHNSWWPTPTPLTERDVNALMTFVDNGGSLFLTSQLFLKSPTGPASFISDYLGVASYTLDPEYMQLDGVAGDPIGDDLTLPLSFPFGSLANGDGLIPTASATICMTEPGGMAVTLANDIEDAGKVVFMAVAFNAVSATDPDPNNLTVVTRRIMEWLSPQDPAGVEEAAVSILGSRIDGARPNPFNPRTEIDVRLSKTGASGPVLVEVFDLTGRKVAGLFEGTLPAGMHTVTWTGRADSGQPAESGVYFVRLSTREGQASGKLILLK